VRELGRELLRTVISILRLHDHCLLAKVIVFFIPNKNIKWAAGHLYRNLLLQVLDSVLLSNDRLYKLLVQTN